MLVLKPPSIGQSVAGAKHPSPHFRYAARHDTPKLAHTLDSSIRVSRRVEGNKTTTEQPKLEFRTRAHTSREKLSHPQRHHQGLAAGDMQDETHSARLIQARHSACAKATSRHRSAPQSRQDCLVPFASLSAISCTFNSLSKVLFTFPSRYLSTIGLELVFSLG